MIKVIVDPGSCHMGKLDYAKELIDVAADAGAWAIKFQLFKGSENGNIELSREWWSQLVDYAKGRIEIFASVFDEEAVQLLHDSGINRAKLAYSQAFNLRLIKKAKKLGMKIWASGDWSNYPEYADVRFICIPEYPPKQVAQVTPKEQRSGIKAFEGFSSHHLGYKTDLRLLPELDVEYLEKHLTLDYDDIDCPDHWFALSPKELRELVKEVSG